MTMLLTLSSGSLRNRMNAKGKGDLTLYDLPQFTIKNLQLHGLNLTASMLAGLSLEDLDRLRDRADKAACPCLVLIDESPLPLGSIDPVRSQQAGDRILRLGKAANRLGCSSIAIRCDAPNSPESLERVTEQLRSMMPQIERLELTVLLSPWEGLTQTCDQLATLIKRIGGFRIGSLPSFGAAAQEGKGNPTDGLRKLAPYAGAIQATIEGFTKKNHKSWDLAACVKAVRSVGFVNTLAIDYVGSGDPITNIEQARVILQAAIENESEPVAAAD